MHFGVNDILTTLEVKENWETNLRAVKIAYCIQWYLHKFVEFQLGDTGLIIEEGVLGGKQVFVCQTLIGGLQGAKNKRSHYQVQYDPRQQGQEGGAPHCLPVNPPAPPGSGVKARPGSGQGRSQDTRHTWP